MKPIGVFLGGGKDITIQQLIYLGLPELLAERNVHPYLRWLIDEDEAFFLSYVSRNAGRTFSWRHVNTFLDQVQWDSRKKGAAALIFGYEYQNVTEEAMLWYLHSGFGQPSPQLLDHIVEVAISHGYLDALGILLPQVHVTPVMFSKAYHRNQPDSVFALLEYVNPREFGDSAMYYAIAHDYHLVVQVLIEDSRFSKEDIEGFRSRAARDGKRRSWSVMNHFLEGTTKRRKRDIL